MCSPVYLRDVCVYICVYAHCVHVCNQCQCFSEHGAFGDLSCSPGPLLQGDITDCKKKVANQSKI